MSAVKVVLFHTVLPFQLGWWRTFGFNNIKIIFILGTTLALKPFL